MLVCTLCQGPVLSGPLLEHYLADADLLQYVQRRQLKWRTPQPICANCLEHFKKEHDAEHISIASESELSSEQTVITALESGMPMVKNQKERPCLLVIHGANFAKKFDINQKEMVVGRSEKADISINEENVSRQHAKILARDGEVTIYDLDSTNGTFVNTKKVPNAVLKDGDLVLIGNTILKFISGSNVESLYHQEILKLATIDGLTQIYNKSYLLERLDEEFSRSRRYRRELSLMLFDFDHFKNVNDQYGHPAGDLILKQTCSLILKNLRKEDIFGRYGGEEFTILFPETSLDIAVKLAEKNPPAG
jgi:GGDEF domain-containing protein